jgi:hypothetical protein
MRIAFVVPSLGPNEGQGSVDLVILRALSDDGHDVHVFAGNASDDVAPGSGGTSCWAWRRRRCRCGARATT